MSPAPGGEAPPTRSLHRQAPGPGRLVLVAGAVVLLLAGGGFATGAVLGGGDDGGQAGPAGSAASPDRDAAPPTTYGAEAPVLDRSRAEQMLDSGHVGLKVTRPQLLRTRPAADGQLVGRALTKTSFGGPQVLPITKARGDWVAVVSPFRRNGKVAWTKIDRDAAFVSVDYSISIRLGERQVVVRRDGEIVKRFRSAIGQVTHPTPLGRFAVTDGLMFSERGPYGYGALVLSARQTKLPPEWQGGDRIAIHGTPNQASIGLAASLGCLRVDDAAARWLVKRIPPGTTVYVKA